MEPMHHSQKQGMWQLQPKKSNKEMKDYVLKVIHAENAEVLSQASLDGMIPFFSGMTSTQTLAKLKAELRQKGSTENWLKYMDNQKSGLEELTGEKDEEERKPAGQWPKTHQEMEEGNSLMVQRMAAEMLSFVDRVIPRVFKALKSTKEALMDHQKVDTANLFSSQDVSALAEALKTNESIPELYLGGNRIKVTSGWFEMVQSLRNTPKMLAFMKTVLQAAGNSAPDEQVLAGLAPRFSGENATQPWSQLVEELRQKGMFPRGAHAALTEAGYKAMSLHNNDTDTRDFVHRVAVADSLGLQTLQSLAFRHGVNGSAKDRSQKGLRKDLHDGNNSDNLLHLIKTDAVANTSVVKAPLVRAIFTNIEESQRNCALPAFMNPAATNELMLSSMMSLAKQIVSATLESVDNARLLLITSEIPRGNVPVFNHVNLFGFESIQALRQTSVMEKFTRMLVQSYGGNIPDSKEVRGLAHLYSGEQASQNWDSFWQYMSDMHWIPHGSTAAFTEAGYQAVSTWKNHEEMKEFIKRFIKSEGGRVLYEPGLDYFVLYNIGEQAVQSLYEMREELRQKAILESWLEFPPPSSSALPLEPAVAADRLTSEMFAFLRKGASGTFEAFDRLRESVTGMTPSSNVSSFHDEVSLAAGYQIVQNSRNSAAMEMFIQMLLSSTGASPADQATLHGIAPLYSGEQDSRSWGDLWADLARREWLPKGSSAALTEAGYQSVAMLKDSSEMEAFVLRVIKEDGGAVLRASGVRGFLPRFDGEERVQSLSAMRSELHGEAQKRGWVKFEGRELCSTGSAALHLQGSRPELAREKSASARANLLMAPALLTLACMYHA